MTRTLRSLVALVAAALLCIMSSSPAQADPDRLMLGLSQAGPFTENLSTPLFTGTYVPGTATSTFYVKNESPSTTRATIALVPKDAINEFERSLSFTASVGGQTGTSVPLQQQQQKKNECRTIVTGPTVAPGAVQRIDVTMHIDPELSRSAMRQSASFAFVVTLSQVTKQGKVDVCGTQSPGGAVQVRGAQAAMPAAGTNGAQELSTAPRSSAFVVGTAAAFLLTGGMLLLARRRRRAVESPT